ncbi:MAG: 50S ribosomal protein L18 [Lachnospiraceae bacterium]|nr:50S ribosomal protein L18 [Lachnospiraceae bacterium]
MIKKESRSRIRQKKHLRIRNRFSGTAERPRLAVFRSNKHIYAQVIDDEAGTTLAAASTVEKDIKGQLKFTDNKEAAESVGKAIAERAKAKGIEEVVFDRGGFLYHGKIQVLADAAREAGLKF